MGMRVSVMGGWGEMGTGTVKVWCVFTVPQKETTRAVQSVKQLPKTVSALSSVSVSRTVGSVSRIMFKVQRVL